MFLTHIPYRGASAVVNDTLGGQIDVGVATLPSVLPLLADGRLRALAVTSRKRWPSLPDVPSFAEAGVPGYESDNWYGIFVPGATPRAVIGQLHAAITKAASTPGFRQRASNEGLQVSLETPEAATRFVRAEEAKWRQVVQQQSIRMD